MRILGFDHIGIAAKDPKALTDWYVKYLGFTFLEAGPSGNFFIETPDKVMLEIMLPGKGEEDVTELTGWKHIALVPADFDEAVAELKRAGIGADAPVNKREDGYCTFFFKDPDGNVVHFAKWADDRGMFR